MPIQRPSLSKTLLQMELNRFYEKPVARVSTALVFSVICIGFFGIFAIRPTLQTMTELVKQIEEKKDLDQKLTQKITALTTAQRELSIKEASFPILDTAIPSTPKFTELLTVLEKVASEKQVSFTGASIPQVPIEQSEVLEVENNKAVTLESLPLSLTFSGSYEQLISLLQELSALQRLLIIDRYDITHKIKDDENLMLSVSLRAFMFTTKQKAKPAGAVNNSL